MQSGTTKRNIWAQLGISACALSLPLMALGAAVYSLLPGRHDGAARPAAIAAPHLATPKSPVETAKPSPTGRNPYPATQTTGPAAANRIPAAEGLAAGSRQESRQEPAGRTAKDAARVSGPLQVTETMAAAMPPPADLDNMATGAFGAEPPGITAVSASLLPRALPGQTPAQMPPPRTPAAQIPAAQIPAAQVPSPAVATAAPTAPESAATARKHAHISYLARLAKRSGAHAEAQSEAHAARRNAQPQQAFSLKNWLQQLGSRSRNPGG